MIFLFGILLTFLSTYFWRTNCKYTSYPPHLPTHLSEWRNPSINITEDTPQILRVLSALSLKKKRNCHRQECKVFSYYFNFYTDIPRRFPLLLFVSQQLTEYSASAEFSFKFFISPLKVHRIQFHSSKYCHTLLRIGHIFAFPPLLPIERKDYGIAFIF